MSLLRSKNILVTVCINIYFSKLDTVLVDVRIYRVCSSKGILRSTIVMLVIIQRPNLIIQ